jgi:hypothetical protein
LKRNLLLFIIPQFGGALMKLFVRHATSSQMLNPCSPTKGLQFQKPSNYKQKLVEHLRDLEYNDQIRLCTICLLSNLSAFNAPRQHVQKEKEKEKHIRKKKQQQTPST